MTKRMCNRRALVFLVGVLSFTTPWVWAQGTTTEKNPAEKNAPEKSTAEKKAPDKVPIGTYRVEFKITELEGEKKLNSRAYGLLLTGFVTSELHAGTRVPIQSGGGEIAAKQFQYMDVGQNIYCQGLSENEHAINLRFNVDFTNFALPEQANATQGAYLPPMVRQFHAQTTTALELGRPTVISTLDDPSSKRTFQIEVTATRVREKE